MKILAIESSCDDTSVALLEVTDTGAVVIAEKTASQIEIHKKYGGVVPEVAGRMHAENILPVVEEVMKDNDKPDAIAVTSGPGLITGLLVGVEVAKSLSYIWGVPLIGMNHIEGHVHSVLLPEPGSTEAIPFSTIQFPALALIASGGHTSLILMKDFGEYELVGNTRDDAAGEAFDKVAKMLDLPYPGGPKISKLAETGNIKAISFPRPMMKDDNFDFSFAGLKTAALYWLRDNDLDGDVSINDFCASFEQAIVDVLVAKTIRAQKEFNAKTVILAGGVSANTKLRQTLEESIDDVPLLLPPRSYCMDNAAMIGVAAYHHAKKEQFVNWKEIEANPNWKIYQ